MSDLLSNISKALSEKMARRVAETKSGRFDFYLSDWEVIGDHEAKILVGYKRDFGVPRPGQLDEWAINSFNGKLRVAMESLRNYPQLEAVSAIVVRNFHTLPFDYSEGMIPVSAAADGTERFQDDDSRIWEALQSDDGGKFLVRIARDDIASILAERQRKIRGASFSHKRPRLSQITAGISAPEIGDQIVFLERGIKQFGQVTHVGETVVHVHANGEDLVVPNGSVIAVQAKSAASDKESDKKLIEFFTKQYGSREFAKKLVTLKGIDK